MLAGSLRRTLRRVRPLVTVGAAAVGVLAASPSQTASASPPSRLAVPGAHTITYCVQGGVSLAMTVFQPTGARRPAPVVLQVHGGGWERGTRMRSLSDSPILAGLVARGFVVASIDYRMAPRYRWPAEMQDVACAVRSLRAHAKELGIDPWRMGAWGSSAGGQLVSLLGTAPHAPGWSGGPYAKEPARVQAVADEFGPVNLTAPVFGGYVTRLVHTTFGVDPGENVAELTDASPTDLVARGDPPFIVLQGTADRLVPASQSKQFAARLRADRVPVRLVLVRGGQHGLGTPGEEPSGARLARDVVRFFIGVLGAQPRRH